MNQRIPPAALLRLVAAMRWRACAAAIAALAPLSAAVPAAEGATRGTRVVVVSQPGSPEAAQKAVTTAGGRVLRRVELVNGVVARVPVRALGTVRDARGVRVVHADRQFRLHSAEADGSPAGFTLAQVRETMGLDAATANSGGEGVDVALIDSGITPVLGLDDPDKVVNGPDLSSDADEAALRHLDAFGHGTHLAGIIGAEGSGVSGVAPGSRLVNVKVADREGGTSLSRLIAAMDWVVRNRSRNGLNIRVMNLAFGAEVLGGYRDDPLALAVEQAWRRGIVVVVAAGNGGNDSQSLDSPAYDPYVVAVGAQDALGTVSRDDDVVAEFSSRGSSERSPDVLAPGVGIVSLGVPGSHLDNLFPQARIGEGGFRGSGTSQSAAAASAALAALLQDRPALNPDEAKAVLRASADPLDGADHTLQGEGAIDILAASSEPVAPDAEQNWKHARGGGPWRGRGALGSELAVEHPNASRWSASRWSASRWSASRWSASRWSASRWSASRWSGAEWGDAAE
jgi:Subtilase family